MARVHGSTSVCEIEYRVKGPGLNVQVSRLAPVCPRPVFDLRPPAAPNPACLSTPNRQKVKHSRSFLAVLPLPDDQITNVGGPKSVEFPGHAPAARNVCRVSNMVLKRST